MSRTQTFVAASDLAWSKVDALPGVDLAPLAQPAPEGSIHRARLAAGAVIPAHTHPADEYVLVLSGTVETGGRVCEAGVFWATPAGVVQGPHIARTEAELLTLRLGPMGAFADHA